MTTIETSNEELAEPLLSEEERVSEGTSAEEKSKKVVAFVNTDALSHSHDNDDEGSPSSAENEATSSFSLTKECWEMASLGLPLAVSYFCRMGMASTDSAFVGHISNGEGEHSSMVYLAAAALSDMVIGVLLVPPLAFNQVLNALVGQAIGSGNPKMAGIWLQQSMFWLSVTMLPCLIGCFYVEPILLLLAFPSDVSKAAGIYAKFNIFWPIPNGLYQCMRFYFQAQGLPKPAMYNNIFFLFVNALLNYVFVMGGPFRYWFGWKGLGFIGAAVSLSISRSMQGLVYFLYMFMYKQHHVRTWPGLSFKHHTRARTSEFLKQTVPNIGTLLFQSTINQATTILVGRLGTIAIATSSALTTVSIPWSGTLSATTGMISAIRVGYHLGRGDAAAAKATTSLVLWSITAVSAVLSVLVLLFAKSIVSIATNDIDVRNLAVSLVPAMLIGNYLNLIVSNVTSGVFSGMGRPLIATILSFGLELPLSIGGLAFYILKMHGNLDGVYWLQAGLGGFEAVIVMVVMALISWERCAREAQERQEANNQHNQEHDSNEERADLLETSGADSVDDVETGHENSP